MRNFLITCLAVQSLAPPGLAALQAKTPPEAPQLTQTESAASDEWPLWENYKRGFFDESGRIIDHDGGGRTTSEAQAYGLFFSLVANDRAGFDRILQWTQTNLAQGDLSSNLPAWLWGYEGDSHARVLDRNSASDADLWMAYTLMQAGRLWQEPGFYKLGKCMADQVAEREVVRMPNLGTVLLPAPLGFYGKDWVELNPSYLPLPVLYGLASEDPEGPWSKIAESTPAVVRHASPTGFALDWVKYSAGHGWEPSKGPAVEPRASFDAIRVYLWAGMTDPHTRGRKELLTALEGMHRYMKTNFYPPMIVSAAGKVTEAHGGVGYSAALLPFLEATGEANAMTLQENRLNISRSRQSGLFGDPPRYYDQNLALFGTGWTEHLFRFSPEGALQVRWRSK